MRLFLRELKIEKPNNNEKKFHPFNLDLFKNGANLKLEKPVTFILGDNGSGKSTLLENIAHKIGFNTLGGNRNHSYMDRNINDNFGLSSHMKLIWDEKTNDGFFFRAESFFSFIGYIDDLAEENGKNVFNPYGGKSLQKQSHGEAFLSLFQNRLSKGVFILDEPESALSPEKQLWLISIMDELVKTNKCQFIIATHSPLLITYPNSTIFEIENGRFNKIRYQDSKQFDLYRRFLDNPERFINYLCEPKGNSHDVF